MLIKLKYLSSSLLKMLWAQMSSTTQMLNSAHGRTYFYYGD